MWQRGRSEGGYETTNLSTVEIFLIRIDFMELLLAMIRLLSFLAGLEIMLDGEHNGNVTYLLILWKISCS